MERVTLTAALREPGKGKAHRARTAGKVPGVLYGKSVQPMSISVDALALEAAVKTRAGMNVLIDLAVAGGDSGLALIRDYQADPFKRRFTHVDFQAITLQDKLDVEIPVVLTGTAVGVKEGGVVEQLRRTIHIRALPTAIPDKIEIDITDLRIGDSLHSEDVALPQGVEFPRALNYTIVAIVPPAKEEVAAVVAAEVPVEGAAPVEGQPAPAEGASTSAAEGAPAKEKKA